MRAVISRFGRIRGLRPSRGYADGVRAEDSVRLGVLCARGSFHGSPRARTMTSVPDATRASDRKPDKGKELPIPIKVRGKTPGRKKEGRRSKSENFTSQHLCSAYATTDDLDVRKLTVLLADKHLIQERVQSHGSGIVGCTPTDAPPWGYVFFFPSGAMVFWGIPMKVRRQVYYTASGLSADATIVEFDDFDHEFEFVEDEKKTQFVNDNIYLQDVHDKDALLALSFGLAQSAKLLVYEEAIDRLVRETQILPEQLALRGMIQMSKTTLKVRLGRLLSARYSVSLLSDIMDTPDFFWEHSQLEILHNQSRSELGLSRRIRLLSNRMDIIKDSLDVINTELAQSSSHRVELYIVALIAVEVAIEVGKLYFGH